MTLLVRFVFILAASKIVTDLVMKVQNIAGIIKNTSIARPEALV